MPLLAVRAREHLGGAGLGRGVCQLGQDLLVAASYCSTRAAGMRPWSLTAMPCSLAHARISPLRSRRAVVHPARRRCPQPALRACSMRGASCWRNVLAFSGSGRSRTRRRPARTALSPPPGCHRDRLLARRLSSVPSRPSLTAIGCLHHARSTVMPAVTATPPGAGHLDGCARPVELRSLRSLVFDRLFRVGRGLSPAVRAHVRRFRDAGAHSQGVVRLVRRPRRGPARLTLGRKRDLWSAQQGRRPAGSPGDRVRRWRQDHGG